MEEAAERLGRTGLRAVDAAGTSSPYPPPHSATSDVVRASVAKPRAEAAVASDRASGDEVWPGRVAIGRGEIPGGYVAVAAEEVRGRMSRRP